ncbi:toll/interleukin-1 receptor domain-containing protein [Vibrio barjaei]|uniref:toll/interleukin-1 receptor domain-containing protein n=1 Tax=Vibrio barjaei TaxID=1676683 RepID=UPI002283B132|nr:toll/interleukin-1 receptor domain-containing protein [Vibrio barjaei]MCY9871174.1 toll/interleukin-1 receptor domain-containing protein [Vibrio barjaei]
MALLSKSDLIKRYNTRQSYLLEDSAEMNYAKNKIVEHANSFSMYETYDVFLSHSFNDARIVEQIKVMLEKQGQRVYVDWIEDDHLDRGKVTFETAAVLRERMNRCSSLIYLTSQSAESSLWMPWELGYMDARTGKVAVAPILEDDESFEGREYLGLYPYFDLTNDSFYIHRNISEWVNFKGWMNGEQPKSHIS